MLDLCPCLPQYIESQAPLPRRVLRLSKIACHRTGNKTLCRQCLYNSRAPAPALSVRSSNEKDDCDTQSPLHVLNPICGTVRNFGGMSQAAYRR